MTDKATDEGQKKSSTPETEQNQQSEANNTPAPAKEGPAAIAKHGWVLGIFATAAAALLVLGDYVTKEAIAERKAEDLLVSLAQVIPADMHDSDLREDVVAIDHQGKKVQVYRGRKKGLVSTLAYETSAFGYSGEITVLMGLKADGSILGVRVLSHTETPGLGDKIEVEKDDWILSFDGLRLDSIPKKAWAVKKDGGQFDQFSGATITPRAVVKAVKDGLDFFAEHQGALLDLEHPKTAPEQGATP